MADLKWRGIADGYVSHDARFLVAPVMVPGKRGIRKAWALYGRVVLQEEGLSERPAHPWGWTEEPLTVCATKGQCQGFAADCSYEVPVIGLHVTAAAPQTDEKRIAYEVCQECGVDFDRKPNWKWEDYCGPNCTETVAERLTDIGYDVSRRSA